MKSVTTHEAKTHLSRLIREAQQGETVVILRGKEPVAQLTAVGAARARGPSIGHQTSEPVRYNDGAFAPLTEEELGQWGL